IRDALRSNRDRGQSIRDIRQVFPAGGRQRKAAGPPAEKGDAQPLFERMDAVAHRARGDAELLGGKLEAFMSTGRFEQAQQPKRWQTVPHWKSQSASRGTGKRSSNAMIGKHAKWGNQGPGNARSVAIVVGYARRRRIPLARNCG